MDMTFGTWKVRPCSWKTVAITNCNLDLVGQVVWLDITGTKPTKDYTFLYVIGNENHQLQTEFFVNT
jgi:hypothetical protein